MKLCTNKKLECFDHPRNIFSFPFIIVVLLIFVTNWYCYFETLEPFRPSLAF